MSDPIDRQAVIDALHAQFKDGFDGDKWWNSTHVVTAIEGVPSAQPEPEEFEWCHDCKEYDQEAHCCHRWTKVIRNTVEEIKNAQPERKKGKWIKATGMMPPEYHGHHCCSECGNFANMKPPFGNREDLSSFCPNCGADMRGGEDDV